MDSGAEPVSRMDLAVALAHITQPNMRADCGSNVSDAAAGRVRPSRGEIYQIKFPFLPSPGDLVLEVIRFQNRQITPRLARC